MAVTTATLRFGVTITALDLIVLALLLHVWLVVAGLAAWNDDAQTGVEWVDRRIHLHSRLYGGLMLIATIVVWLPFAVGQYPIGPNNPFGRSRAVLVPLVAGGLLVGSGCYFLGGLLTNLRSFLAFRRTDPVDAATVTAGPVRVSGRVTPIGEPLETPLTGTEAVCYRLSATRTTMDGRPSESERGVIDSGPGSLLASLAEETTRLDDERTRFALEDGTGAVVVDPANAELRLERTASEPVPGGAEPPEPLATHLLETSGLGPTDRDRVYHEAALEPGDEVSVLGFARDGANLSPASGTDPSSEDEPRLDGPTIAAGETATEFVVAPGCDDRVDRHYRTTILGCTLAFVALAGSGFWLLWLLAGH